MEEEKENIDNIDNHEEDEKENINTQRQTNIMRVHASSLAGKFRAKSDIYTYLSQKLQMFLPPIEEAKISYLRGLLNGTKMGLLNKDVTILSIPRFPELSVKQLWPIIKDDPDASIYFPSYADDKCPSAKFFFGIISAVKPEFIKEAIDECLNRRNRVQEDDDQEDYIEMTQSVYNAIMNDDWLSKAKGRGVYLLKKKAKVEFKKKKTKKSELSYEVMELLKKD